MNVDDILRNLGVDPARLDPAPPRSTRMPEAVARLDTVPCVACGAPARATRVVDIPGHGRRWIDTCRDHLLAIHPRGGRPGPVEETLAVLADAARKAGVTLTVITDA